MPKLTAKQRRRLFEELFGDDDDGDEDGDENTGGGRLENVNVTIDLGDEAAVERGLKLGFLTIADLEDADDNGDGDDADGDDDKGKRKPDKAPSSRGYFKS